MTVTVRSALWPFLMAWRDGRASLPRLTLSVVAAAVGIAGMVASYSFNRTVADEIGVQAKVLLAADLVLESKDPMAPEIFDLARSRGLIMAEEIRFRAMLAVPASGQTALVQLRAIDPQFPLYGELQVEPKAAKLYDGNVAAFVDSTLLVRLDVKPGDDIEVAGIPLRVGAAVRASPGDAGFTSAFAPRVYVPLAALPKEKLSQKGALVEYRLYLKSSAPEALSGFRADVQTILQAHHIDVRTVDERARQLGRVNENATRFFAIASLAALLLGAFATASSVYLYLQRKLPVASTLKCLGASGRQTVAVFIIELLFLACVAAILGLSLGELIFSGVVRALNAYTAFSVSFRFYPGALLFGICISLGTVLLCSLIPLSLVARSRPLALLRPEETPTTGRVAVCLAALSFLAVLLPTTRTLFGGWKDAAIVSLSCFGALLSVVALVHGARFLARAILARSALPFAFRQGAQNLYRPGSQSVVVLTALSLTLLVLGSIYTSQHLLTRQAEIAREEDKPSLFIFDVQTDQVEPAKRIIKAHGAQVLQVEPIVMMRISSINGVSVSEILPRAGEERPERLLRRDWWNTYRAYTLKNEQVVRGNWVASVPPDTEVIPISMDDKVAERLGLSLDDEVIFDLQGVAVRTRIASLRDIMWEQLERNSLVVFPEGVLEEAPQLRFITARTSSAEQSAIVQREINAAMPNISMIDISSILETIERILDRIAHALLYVSTIIALTAVLVLMSTVSSARSERVKEGAILRILGADRSTVQKVLLSEYALLAFIAALVSTVLSALAAYGFATYVFHTGFSLPVGKLFFLLSCTALVSTATALVAGRGVLKYSPLEVLRRDAQ